MSTNMSIISKPQFFLPMKFNDFTVMLTRHNKQIKCADLVVEVEFGVVQGVVQGVELLRLLVGGCH